MKINRQDLAQTITLLLYFLSDEDAAAAWLELLDKARASEKWQGEATEILKANLDKIAAPLIEAANFGALAKLAAVQQAILTEDEKKALAPALPTLRRVKWVGFWDRGMRELHTDVGTTEHLTKETGLTGKTLCGREFPRDKGYASANRFCKRCLKIARNMGFQQGFTKDLEAVGSVRNE